MNRSLQGFLQETYGAALWDHVALSASLPREGFEAMLLYPDEMTAALIAEAAQRLEKSPAALVEDLGAWLVMREPMRRLMRFGGRSYPEFLQSLDELPGRARLAVPDLRMPELALEPLGPQGWQIRLATAQDPDRAALPTVFLSLLSSFLAGLLRAMADDYGALAVIDHRPGENSVTVELLELAYSSGRGFALAPPTSAPQLAPPRGPSLAETAP